MMLKRGVKIGKLLTFISEETGLDRKDIRAVFEAIKKIIKIELVAKKGQFLNLFGLFRITVHTKKGPTEAEQRHVGFHPDGTPRIFNIPAKPIINYFRLYATDMLKKLINEG